MAAGCTGAAGVSSPVLAGAVLAIGGVEVARSESALASGRLVPLTRAWLRSNGAVIGVAVAGVAVAGVAVTGSRVQARHHSDSSGPIASVARRVLARTSVNGKPRLLAGKQGLLSTLEVHGEASPVTNSNC